LKGGGMGYDDADDEDGDPAVRTLSPEFDAVGVSSPSSEAGTRHNGRQETTRSPGSAAEGAGGSSPSVRRSRIGVGRAASGIGSPRTGVVSSRASPLNATRRTPPPVRGAGAQQPPEEGAGVGLEKGERGGGGGGEGSSREDGVDTLSAEEAELARERELNRVLQVERERELNRVLQVESARLETQVAVAEFREKREEERRRKSTEQMSPRESLGSAPAPALRRASAEGERETRKEEPSVRESEEDAAQERKDAAQEQREAVQDAVDGGSEGEADRGSPPGVDLDGALAEADAAAEEAVAMAEAGKLSEEQEGVLDKLLRQVDRLQSRLSEYRDENEQLESLVEVERRRSRALEEAARVGEMSIAEQDKRYAKDVADLGRDRDDLESALADKSDAYRELAHELEEVKEELWRTRAELDKARESVGMSEQSRWLEEQRANERAQEQVRALERRMEEERASHAATRTEAALREGHLEAQVTDAQRNLARVQRSADAAIERADKAARDARELERDARLADERVAELEARLEKAEGHGGAASSPQPEPEGEREALKEEVERVRGQLRDAHDEVDRLEAEVQRARVEALAGAQQELDDLRAMRGENDARFSQLTEHLYSKQSQLENALSERQAAALAVEREQRVAEELRAEVSELRRRGGAAAGKGAPVEGFMPTVPVYREVGMNRRVVTVANVLDQASANFLVLMRSFPLLRLAFIAYLVGLHIFVYAVLHRMQNIHVDHHDEHHGALPGQTIQSASAAAGS